MNTLDLNVHRLLQLLQIVESGSINKAAHALNISQPALTRSIRTLERSLNVLLLDRSVKGVVPTPQGSLLVASARAIKANLNQAIGNIQIMSADRIKVLRVGTTSGVGWLITEAIERLQVLHPALGVRAIEAHTGNLLAQLKLGEVDLVLCPSVDDPEPGIEGEPMFAQDFCLWVRKSHHLAGRSDLTLPDLAAEPWIVPQRESRLRAQLDSMLREAHVKLSGPVLECSSHMMARELLVRHDRIAVLARTTLEIERRAGFLDRLEGRWSFPFQSYTCYARSADRTLELQTLIELITDTAKENLRPPTTQKTARKRRHPSPR
jgi:DNA-binding transcriptional LysR family regulator